MKSRTFYEIMTDLSPDEVDRIVVESGAELHPTSVGQFSRMYLKKGICFSVDSNPSLKGYVDLLPDWAGSIENPVARISIGDPDVYNLVGMRLPETPEFHSSLESLGDELWDLIGQTGGAYHFFKRKQLRTDEGVIRRENAESLGLVKYE